MTVERLITIDGFQKVALPRPDREISGGYCGDLLSWVMGRACADSAWITIMSNINIVAVAALSDVACVILSESVELGDDVIETARAKGINILSTDLPSFEISVRLAKLLG